MISTGGTNLRDDIMRLQSVVHIMVATPGRILDLAEKHSKFVQMWLSMFLDEADKLLSPTFEPIIEKLINFCAQIDKFYYFPLHFQNQSNRLKSQY